jgi:hypothetical protein
MVWGLHDGCVASLARPPFYQLIALSRRWSMCKSRMPAKDDPASLAKGFYGRWPALALQVGKLGVLSSSSKRRVFKN